jgi:hypothetical protein
LGQFPNKIVRINMQKFASNFLTFLERREEKLLSWGFHNVQYSEKDMEGFLLQEAPQDLQDQWSNIQTQGVTFRSLIRELRRSHLLHRIPDTTDMYRTRMAEGVRLLANLRQMFKPQDWATGPRLVSDIKIHLKDRIYPRRDLLATDVWNDKLVNLCPPNEQTLLKDCYDALSRDGQGNELKFAGFQKRAFEHIFKEYCSGNYSGSVICAGTGSGKTKAFYIPAFLRVVEEVSKDPFPYTKIIAIYPRNVLLADQLREALSEVLKLKPVLDRIGQRSITLGALLGASPTRFWFNQTQPGRSRPNWYWDERVDGHVIPFLKSPFDGKSELIWKKVDRENDRTSLYRLGETIPDIPNGVLRISREQLMQDPPDILFLSLEMLNREMGNHKWNKSFGIKQGKRSPRLILLDEVHTYEGIPGAQAAWVLRRWKHWMRSGANAKSPHFVGLSATLKEASEHMGRMCGIYPDNVTEFIPIPGTDSNGEMEAEGQEYNLAIKGDPSSGTSLLSTSIQTGMLLTRLLTPRNQSVSVPAPSIQANSFFVRKTFGFTDNLDSLNRWFANMRDAERKPLARFRAMPSPIPDPHTLQRMRSEGQIWEHLTDIGHDLTQSLIVSRCSSQDPGANTNSDLILATSSLEVGFDDPQVGMILQHKAPASMSSFIQRKGRAGRTRGSRPWTTVILSDYGRDRWAFQSAEYLFNPEIDHIHLPIANPYVLRVQMALFLVDWLGQKIDIDKANSPFTTYLNKTCTWYPDCDAQEMAKGYLEDFLNQGDKWKRFYEDAFWFYFNGRGGLSTKRDGDKKIATSELNDIFWEEPRPLLTEGIPALLRKLDVKWKQSGPGDMPDEDKGAGRPMPQSIPKATFSELDLSEARVELESYNGRNKEDELLPIPQFLRECCPGRVSKRFSTLTNELGYWHEYSPQFQSGHNNVSISQLYPEHISLGVVDNTQVYCPTSVKLIHIPQEVIESSLSEWVWNTIANTHNNDKEEPLPLKGSKPWNKVFSKMTAHLHINGSWIELLRYTKSCRFEIRKRQGNSIQGILNLQNDDSTLEAVGFQLNVDGMRFVVDEAHLMNLPGITPKLLGQSRYEYFMHQLKSSSVLKEHLNVFQTEWMAQISISMLTATAIRKKILLPEAQQRLNSIRPEAARRVLEAIFQVRGVGLSGNEEEPRLKQDLLDLWRNATIVSEIERLESALWNNPPGPDFNEWIQKRYLATLAQALRVAVVTVSDQVSEEDLVVDVISLNDNHEILITEKSSGGLGQMESIVREIKDDPRFFLDALEYALVDCPRDSWASNLFAITKCAYKEHLDGSGTLIDAFSEVRNASNFGMLEAAKESLISAFHSRGINQQRNTISAVSMKLLRPGSSKNTDGLTYLLNESWHRQNNKIGLEIPVRTFAYLVSEYPPSFRRLKALFIREYGETPSPSQLYVIVQQLLFEGCKDSCPDCLNNPNYFNDFDKPARNIALLWLSLEITEIDVCSETDRWISRARDVLIKDGRVCLVADMALHDQLVNNLVPLFFEELNVQLYRESVHISRIERTGGFIKITLIIRNFTNV